MTTTPGPPDQTPSPEKEAPKTASASESAPLSEALPRLAAALAPEEVVERLLRLSRQGKLPGFARVPGEPGRFVFSAFGGVFDHRVEGRARSISAGGSEIAFSIHALRRAPAIMIAVIILTVWPGLPLTDSMIRLYFDAYERSGIRTWWWYLPLVVISLPPLWKQWKKAQREARKDALERIDALAAALSAQKRAG